MLQKILNALDQITIERLGLAVAVGLLFATWYQGCLTRNALKETRTEYTAGQRPFVSLGRKDGTIAEFVDPKTPNVLAGIKVYLQNGGHSPALTPNIAITTTLILNAIGTEPEAHPFRPQLPQFQNLTRYRYIKGGGWGGTGTRGSIPPGSEYVYFAPNILSQEQLMSMRQGKRTLMLTGVLEYCDELGNYSCRQFTLFFQGPTIDAFSEVTETDCAFMYTYPPRQPNQEFLLPCEQPDEREAREHQEKQELARRAMEAPTSPTAAPTRAP